MAGLQRPEAYAGVCSGKGESAADQFTYIGPLVTGIAPTSGPAVGGTSVTITGSGFTGATVVNFGTAAATTFTVDSATQITAASPSGES
jgi:hypothetical protein